MGLGMENSFLRLTNGGPMARPTSIPPMANVECGHIRHRRNTHRALQCSAMYRKCVNRIIQLSMISLAISIRRLYNKSNNARREEYI